MLGNLTRFPQTQIFFGFLSLVVFTLGSVAQSTFSSGSTGADGAFNPTTNTEVQIPESGVFNFTTITIPAGVTVTFKKNSRNTPVIMLATGDVTISGTINVDGKRSNGNYGGEGGPGGFRGGNGGWPFEHPDGFPGEGPGGGMGGKGTTGATEGGHAGHRFDGTGRGGMNGEGGKSYGNSNITPLIGGSGGGGFGTLSTSTSAGLGGGGGGGTILIASSTAIRFLGQARISALGGDFAGDSNRGGAGSGGAIRLVANSLSGSPVLAVNGGVVFFGTAASPGYVRVEANDLIQFTPSDNSFSRGLPSPAILPKAPSLKIVSVGGVNAPANPAASLALNPDIVVPTSVTNPVTVSIQATNIPLGTVVQITQVTDANVKTTVNSTPLAGTVATSTATASVTLPTAGMSVLTATTTLNALVAFHHPLHINGERVERVEIASAFGGQSQVTYITATGKRLKWPE